MKNNNNDNSKRGRKKAPKGKLIDHTYYDYSTRELSEVLPNNDDSDEKPKGRVTFPMKLHAIMSNPNYHHIIRWMPHGRSWKILNSNLLASVVCTENFNHSSHDSFNRSVNGWGFKRLMSPGPDHKSYYHELFLRGRPELTLAMERLQRPGKRIPDPAGEPNFYDIAKSFPLPPDPSLPSDPNVDTASIHDQPNFGHENQESFRGGKASSQHDVISTVDSPRKRSLEPPKLHEIRGSHRQETHIEPFTQTPILHQYHSDQHVTKRQHHERHSYPLDGYCNPPPGHQPQYFHRHYPPHPYPFTNSPYGYANNAHFQNPYASPERHYHQHSHFRAVHPQDYQSHGASHSDGGYYGYYNQQQWQHQGHHDSYGNHGTPDKIGGTIAAGQYNPAMSGNYHDRDGWNRMSCDQFQFSTNQGTYNTEAIQNGATSAASSCYGVQPYESSFRDSGKESLDEHFEPKPTKYIISAQGLQPVKENNATGAQLDEQKPPAISNRFATAETSPFTDKCNSKDRTNSVSEMYELLRDSGSRAFSAEGLQQPEGNDTADGSSC